MKIARIDYLVIEDGRVLKYHELDDHWYMAGRDGAFSESNLSNYLEWNLIQPIVLINY
jgi:hypothetical protein